MRKLVVSETIDGGILWCLNLHLHETQLELGIPCLVNEATAAGEKKQISVKLPLDRMFMDVTIQYDPSRPNKLRVERP